MALLIIQEGLKKKEGHFIMIKDLVHQGHVIINVYITNYKALKCRKQGQVLMLGEQHYILETLNM